MHKLPLTSDSFFGFLLKIYLKKKVLVDINTRTSSLLTPNQHSSFKRCVLRFLPAQKNISVALSFLPIFERYFRLVNLISDMLWNWFEFDLAMWICQTCRFGENQAWEMARKKIREYDSKRLLKEHFQRLSGRELPIKSAQVSAV